MRAIIPVLLLALCCLPGLARQDTPAGLPTVDFSQDTLSLPPAYFPELPQPLAAWLEQRSYRIPQMNPAESDIPIEGINNVISGNFDGTGKDDWAAIVFRSDTIKAFVFFNSDTTRIEQINIIEKSKFEDEMKTMKIHSWYHSFHLLLYKRDKELLINKTRPPLDHLSGDTLSILLPWTHDAFIVDRISDMAPPGTVRYYKDNKWFYIDFH